MTEQNDEKGIAETLEIGKEGRPGRRWGRWAIVVLVLVIAVAAGWYFLKPDPKATATQYKTEQVRRGDLTVIVTATGTLKPTNSVDVGSELSGIVKSVEADYNSRVKVGQVLARLDTSKLEATITQSKASLESAQAKVLQTQATVTETRAKLAQLKNAREISAGRLSSQAEVDAAEAAFARAQADTASADGGGLPGPGRPRGERNGPRQGGDPLADQRHRPCPQRRARADRGRRLPVPGALQPGRRPDPDGPARQRGRGRHRQDPGGAEGDLHRGRLPEPHLHGADHPGPLRLLHDLRRRDLRNDPQGGQP